MSYSNKELIRISHVIFQIVKKQRILDFDILDLIDGRLYDVGKMDYRRNFLSEIC